VATVLNNASDWGGFGVEGNKGVGMARVLILHRFAVEAMLLNRRQLPYSLPKVPSEKRFEMGGRETAWGLARGWS
jgi:hypothetical protein